MAILPMAFSPMAFLCQAKIGGTRLAEVIQPGREDLGLHVFMETVPHKYYNLC